VLELVHYAADSFLLRLGLMSSHWFTSRNSLIVEIVRQAASVPGVMRLSFFQHFMATTEPIARVSRW